MEERAADNDIAVRAGGAVTEDAEMEAGSRMYRVVWRNGHPFLEFGIVVKAGPKKQRWMVQFKDGKRYEISRASATELGAINEAIVSICDHGGTHGWRKRIPQMPPEVVATSIARLTRLKREISLRRKQPQLTTNH